jgi:hypothetical protein
MRVWDINPGYLNRQSLLGEHREIHAIVSILRHDKTGYARHPETRRWAKTPGALQTRHDLVVSEMELRGYHHRSPVPASGGPRWPEAFLDPPGRQFTLLGEKYRTRDPGRIPLPRTPQQLWAHHKYSVMARSSASVHRIGALVAARQSGMSLDHLARELVAILRVPPSAGRLVNALQHMWGYVSGVAPPEAPDWSCPRAVLTAIRTLAVRHQVGYLLASTALSELQVWMPVESAAEPMSQPGGGAEPPGADGRPNAAAPHSAARRPGASARRRRPTPRE